jgi:hypothetical protein
MQRNCVDHAVTRKAEVVTDGAALLIVNTESVGCCSVLEFRCCFSHILHVAFGTLDTVEDIFIIAGDYLSDGEFFSCGCNSEF